MGWECLHNYFFLYLISSLDSFLINELIKSAINWLNFNLEAEGEKVNITQ